MAGLVCLLGLCAFTPSESRPTIFLMGDSTMATKDMKLGNPERGWGQMLPRFFDNTITVQNHARNGRSTTSFINEGLWQVVADRLQKGDYLVIQFGHNDAKVDTDRYASPEQYAQNLRLFIDTARQKGATPILMTPVIRRAFAADTLTDTHGLYPQTVKEVALEKDVLFVDMEALTRDFFEGLGEVASRSYFMNLPAGKYASAPEGKVDNTHYVARGARAVARMVAQQFAQQVPALADHLRFYDVVVAQDGSGDFMTIQEAIDALPNFSKIQETTLFIANGTYEEKVNIPSTKQNLHIIGESVEGVVITYSDYAGRKGYTDQELGTSGSATVYIAANHFVAENLTFCNAAGPVGQAVAVQTLGTEQYFINCRFLGDQDTLYLYGRSNREGQDTYEANWINYFKDCYIEGTTDFIFGSAMALFENCTLHSKKNSYITAASTCKGQPFGFVFKGCTLTAAQGVDRCYLGRPWRLYAQTVFIDCHMDSHICPEGWHNWSKPEAEKTALYAEYRSQGPGAQPQARVKWAKELKQKEVEKYYAPLFPIRIGQEAQSPH